MPRDYIHIIDLAKGHVQAMKLLFGDDSNKIWAYNLGTGKPHSVLDVLKEHCLIEIMYFLAMSSANFTSKLRLQISVKSSNLP